MPARNIVTLFVTLTLNSFSTTKSLKTSIITSILEINQLKNYTLSDDLIKNLTDLNYGCWCNLKNWRLAKGPVQDEFDKICKDLVKSYRCLKNDGKEFGSCEPNGNIHFPANFSASFTGVSHEKQCEVLNENDFCGINTCKIDAEFSLNFAEKLNFEPFDHFLLDFDKNENCLSRNFAEHGLLPRTCYGDFPFRFPSVQFDASHGVFCDKQNDFTFIPRNDTGNSTPCLKDKGIHDYGNCKAFHTLESCENCMAEESYSKHNQIVNKDEENIDIIYSRTDFSNAFFVISNTGLILNETEYEYTFPTNHPREGETITTFPNPPERVFDGILKTTMAFSPPGYFSNSFEDGLEVLAILSEPKFINFVRFHPRLLTGCHDCCDLCKLDRNYYTIAAVNTGSENEVFCESRYLYDKRKMQEVLDGCHHWLYFDCSGSVLASNVTIRNLVGEKRTTGRATMQMTELQVGFLSLPEF